MFKWPTFREIKHTCSWRDKLIILKLELCLMVVSVLLKIELEHTQISVPKIGIPMLKTASINSCQFDYSQNAFILNSIVKYILISERFSVCLF